MPDTTTLGLNHHHRLVEADVVCHKNIAFSARHPELLESVLDGDSLCLASFPGDAVDLHAPFGQLNIIVDRNDDVPVRKRARVSVIRHEGKLHDVRPQVGVLEGRKTLLGQSCGFSVEHEDLHLLTLQWIQSVVSIFSASL